VTGSCEQAGNLTSWMDITFSGLWSE